MISSYRRAFAVITASMYFMILAGCGGGDGSPTQPTTPTPPPPAPPAPVATSVSINPSSHTLSTVGATIQLTATVKDQNNNTMSGQTVTWTSANTAVATVSGNGLVTAVSNGTSQITARSGNASGSASITVAEPVPTRITIAPSSHTLEAIGATVQLRATVRDQRNNVMSGQTVTWSSGAESVATVSEAGLVTSVSNGMADITAHAGDVMGSAAITVSQVPDSISIEVDAEATTLTEIGQTLQLMVSVSDANNKPISEPAVSWSSTDESVVTVDEDGLVTAVGNGTADVKAASGDVSASVSITVIDPDDGDDGEEVPDEVDEIVYVSWTGVKVARGMLLLEVPGLGSFPLTSCVSALLGGELKDAKLGDYTFTVHYSMWQRRNDMDSPWTDIDGTRRTLDACPYDTDDPGEYRLVGDATLNGERDFRQSENTFVVP